MAANSLLPGCVLLASGLSSRFGQDKLLYPLNGVPLLRRACLLVPKEQFCACAAVVRTPNALAIARDCGWLAVENRDPANDMAVTIRLGLSALPQNAPGCMFMVADQPRLRRESLIKLVRAFLAEPDCIHALSYQGRRGNPVIFPRALFDALLWLPSGESGRYVLKQNQKLLRLTEANDPWELLDIDTPADLPPKS